MGLWETVDTLRTVVKEDRRSMGHRICLARELRAWGHRPADLWLEAIESLVRRALDGGPSHLLDARSVFDLWRSCPEAVLDAVVAFEKRTERGDTKEGGHLSV